MARPRKKGLEYFPMDVDFFSDKKVRILKSRYGADGITIYIYLLCEIYKNGFYVRIDEDYEYIIADDLGMSHDKVKQVLKFLLERSLLDSTLFQSDTIITSQGIQRRFQEAVKSRASKSIIEVEEKYWLLKRQETQPFIKCTLNGDYSEKNPSYSEKNPSYSEKNDIKKRKEKKRKEKYNTRACEIDFECFWNAYPRQTNRILAEQEYIQLITTTEQLDNEILIKAAANYADKCRIEETQERFIKSPANWLRDGTWTEYTSENYKPPKPTKKPQDKFNNFNQRSYNYDELEQQLLQKGST